MHAMGVDGMFETWSPETQEQVLSEWNDWEEPGKKNTWYYSELHSEAKGELRRDSCIDVYLHVEKRMELAAFQSMDSVPKHKQCFNFMIRFVKNFRSIRVN